MSKTKLTKNQTRICLICTTIIFIIIIFADYFSRNVSQTMTKQKGIFIPIIMYHSISRDESMQNDYVISPITLEKDIVYLKQKGYTPIFVQEIIDYVHIDTPLPEKPIVLTFDDGFSDNLEYLLPLLEKYDFKATVSVVGSYTEISDNSKINPYLKSEEITKLYESCHVEIANHSYDMHSTGGVRNGCSIISGESYEEYRNTLLTDLDKTQKYLLENCKILPTVFTYPYGFVCEPSMRIVKSAGFKASLGVEEKPNFITKDPDCLYNLNRYNRPSGIETEDFFEKVLEF